MYINCAVFSPAGRDVYSTHKLKASVGGSKKFCQNKAELNFLLIRMQIKNINYIWSKIMNTEMEWRSKLKLTCYSRYRGWWERRCRRHILWGVDELCPAWCRDSELPHLWCIYKQLACLQLLECCLSDTRHQCSMPEMACLPRSDMPSKELERSRLGRRL